MEKSIIVIENFHVPYICTDEEGETLYFENMRDAERYAENCQCPTIVELNTF